MFNKSQFYYDLNSSSSSYNTSDTSIEVNIGVTPSLYNNFENEGEIPTIPHPHDYKTNKTNSKDDDRSAEDSSSPPGSSPKLIDYLLARDRSKRSIFILKRSFDSLFTSKCVCDDLICWL